LGDESPTFTILSRMKLELEKTFWKDVEKLVGVICDEYSVINKGDKQKVSVSDIIKVLKWKTIKTTENTTTKRCGGVTKDGSLCTRLAKGDSMFCKIHQDRINNTGNTVQGDTHLYVVNSSSALGTTRSTCNKDSKKLQMQLIGDMFYNVDETYIYDVETGETVGIVDNGQYILSDDPFVLACVE
jgi:hypothetical protein